jgi:hypothetical protein
VDDKLKQLYDYSKQEGVSVPPDYNAFAKGMQDDNTSQQFYKYLKQEGIQVPESYDAFSSELGLKKKSTPTPSTESGKPSGSEAQSTSSKPVQSTGSVQSPQQPNDIITDGISPFTATNQTFPVGKPTGQTTALRPPNLGNLSAPSEAQKPIEQVQGQSVLSYKEPDTASAKPNLEPPSYNINGRKLTEKEFAQEASKDDFILQFINGEHKVEILNDPNTAESFYNRVNQEFTETDQDRAFNSSPSAILNPTSTQVLNSIGQSFIKGFAGIPKSVAILADKLDDVSPDWLVKEEQKEKVVDDYVSYQAGKAMDEFAEDLFPTSSEYQDSFLKSTLPSGAGTLLSFAVGGMGGGASKLPSQVSKIPMLGKTLANTTFNNGTLLLGSTSLGSQEYEQALAETGDPDKAWDAFKYNMAIGTTEAIPIASFFNKLNKVLPNSVPKLITEGFTGGLEEATQEIFQQGLTNFTAQQTYDEGREIISGVAEGGAAGFLLGAAMNSLGMTLRSKPDITPELSDKADELIRLGNELQQDPDAVVSSSMFSNEKLNDLRTQKDAIQEDLSKGQPQQIAQALENQVSQIDKEIAEELPTAVDEVVSERLSTQLEEEVKTAELSGASKEIINSRIKPKEDAKEQQGEAVREQSKEEEVDRISDKDLPKLDKTELQDGKKEEVVEELIVQEVEQPIVKQEKTEIPTKEEASSTTEKPKETIATEKVEETQEEIEEPKAVEEIKKGTPVTFTQMGLKKTGVKVGDTIIHKEGGKVYKYREGTSMAKDVKPVKLSDQIRNLKIDTKGKALDATAGLPIAVYNGAVEVVATAVEGAEITVDAVKKGLDYIRSNAKPEDLDKFKEKDFYSKFGIDDKGEFTLPKQYEAATRKRVAKEMGITEAPKNKTGVKKKIKQATEGKIPTTPKKQVSEKAMLKDRIRNYARGIREGRADVVKEAKSFAEGVKAIVKGAKGQLTKAQQKSLIEGAAKAATPTQQSNFLKYAEKVIDNSNYTTELSTAKKQQTKSKKRLKNNYFGVDNGSMRNALSLDPRKLSQTELNDFNGWLEDLNSKPYSPKENINSVKKFEDIAIKQKEETTETPKESKPQDKTIEVANFKKAQKQKGKPHPDYKDDYDTLMSIRDSDLENLSASEIAEITQALYNMREGYGFSGKTADVIRTVKANRIQEVVAPVINDRKFKTLLRDFFNPFKAKSDKLVDYVKNIPLNRIDSMLKGTKGTVLYKTLIQPISLAYEKYSTSYKKIQDDFNKKVKKLKNPEESMVKLQLIAMDKEHASNPNNKEVSPLKNYIEEIKKAAKDDDKYRPLANEYVKIYEEMLKNGEFNYVKQYKKLTQAEKDVFDFVEQTFADNQEKARISALRNGDNVTIRQFYTPTSVKLTERSELGEIKAAGTNFASDKNINATTASGNLIQRDGQAQPIYLNFADNFEKGIKGTLLDYYLREPLRTASRGINKMLSSDMDAEGKDFLKAVNNTLNEVTKNNFINEYYTKYALLDRISRLGYAADLGSIERSVTELGSNVAWALTARPADTGVGLSVLTKEYNKNKSFSRIKDLVRDLDSAQFDRMFNSSQSIMQEQGGGKKFASSVVNEINASRPIKWAKKVGLSLDKGIQAINNGLMAYPDQALSRPLWIGSFMRDFKDKTGKDFDIDKFNNDPNYKEEYSTQIKMARDRADAVLSQGLSTLNPYEGVLSSQVTTNDGIWGKFDKYMTRFQRFEFQSMVDAIEGMVGRNELTKTEASTLMMATIARMTVYQAFLGIITNGILGLIESGIGLFVEGFDDEAKDEEYEWSEQLKQGFAGSIISAILFRRLGNVAKVPLSFAVEKLNAEFGEDLGLRDGDYDGYKDGVVFSTFPVDGDAYDYKLSKILPKFMGSYNKIAKTSTRAAELVYSYNTAKKQSTRDKKARELTQRILPEYFMEIAGAPFPKTIRNLILREQFKDYKESKPKPQTKKYDRFGGDRFKNDRFGNNRFK